MLTGKTTGKKRENKNRLHKSEQIEIYISGDTVMFDAYTGESRRIGEKIGAGKVKNNK